jgi:hypothetical protein
MVSFKLRPLYPPEIPQYPLNRRLGSDRGLSRNSEKEINFLPVLGFEPRNVQPAVAVLPRRLRFFSF